MKKLFAVFAFAFAAAVPGPALAADNVGTPFSGWTWGNPQPQGSTLNDISFAGGVGYAAGDFGTLIKTANGGLTCSITA